MKELLETILNQFSGPVTVEMISLSLIFAFITSLFIVLVYRKTYSGIVYNKAMPMNIILLSLVTAMIIRTINSNLSLSLGMVGALSIVRFRTAVKDPLDTSFMFWGITAGIMNGAGLYIAGLIGSLLLGLLYYLVYLKGSTAKSQYLLVLVYAASADNEVANQLNGIKKKKLKSRSVNSANVIEMTYEMEYNDDTKALMDNIQKIPGVQNVNLVSYNIDFGS